MKFVKMLKFWNEELDDHKVIIKKMKDDGKSKATRQVKLCDLLAGSFTALGQLIREGKV